MAAFTIFFCGTGSNSYDFANNNYHQGELISTLAKNHAGHEFVDWIIVDGPGSGNIQEAEKWVPAGNYAGIRGTLSGKGWEENVQHAIAVLIGSDYEERTSHTRTENRIFREAGVGVDTVERTGRVGRALLGPTKKVHFDLHARISPQALQQRKIQIMRKNKPVDCVNVVGWSRGGVTCHMFANALAETEGWSHIPVNIFACDPVPGSGNFDTHRISLGRNVKRYVAIYAADERSRGFSPVLPSLASNTEFFITTMPGRHATLVGNASNDGGKGVNTLFGPGKVTRDLAESFLQAWGTQLNQTLRLADLQILAHYEEMLAQSADFCAMRNVSYTYFTQSDRAIGTGDGTWRTFGTSSTLSREVVFVNLHHRWLFEKSFPLLCSALFRNQKLTRKQVETEFQRVGTLYPILSNRLKRIPVQLK
ncbi:MAG: hypothetical protein U5M53_00250 [Rhodoferax sp.]|nr:hypothetical protein [Rhodoferax sp.]